jgi:DNA-binding GntR family transcriptional regulator
MIDIETGRDWLVEKTPALSDIVAERIFASILDGHMKPGERIVELSLARKLGVSRGPLREALKTLHAAQVVRGRKGESMRVAEASAEQVVQMLLVRATLEGLGARMVAAFRSPVLLAPLIDLHAASLAAAQAGRITEWRDLDWRFHEAVCHAAGNAYLFSSWRTISNLVRLFLQHHPGFEHDSGTVIRNHGRLMQVLEHGTPDAAEAVFRGSIIGSGYARLGLPVPPHLQVIVQAAALPAGEQA